MNDSYKRFIIAGVKKGYNKEYLLSEYEKIKVKPNPLAKFADFIKELQPIKQQPERISLFLNRNIPPVSYLVTPLIPTVGVTILYGAPKSGKTKLMEYIMLKGEKGQNILNYTVDKPFTVLWYDEENGEENMHTDLTCLCNGMEYDISDVRSHLLCFSGLRLNKDCYNMLEQHIISTNPDIVVIDSIAKVMQGSENDVADVRKIFTIIGKLSHKYHLSFVLLHHSPKDRLDMRGSGEFHGMVDSAISLRKVGSQPDDNGATRINLSQTARRQGREAPSINFTIGSDADNDIDAIPTIREITFIGLSREVMKEKKTSVIVKCANDIINWCKDNPQSEYTTSEVKEEMQYLGYKHNAINDAIKKLVDDGRFVRIKKGHYKVGQIS